MRRIFRQQALEHMSSAEPLDQLLQVVRPKHWLALLTCGAFVALALLWGVWGRLPTTVQGQGVLVRPRQVVNVQAPAAGRLAQLAVQVGDIVKVGDVLGTIDQAKIRQQLQEERRKLHELQVQDEAKSTLQNQNTTLQAQQIRLEVRAIELQRRDLRKRLRDAEAKAPLLKQRFENHMRLEELGLLPKISDARLQAEKDYLDNQDALAEFRAHLKQLESDLKRLKRDAKSFTLQNMDASTSRKNQIQALRSQIALLELQLKHDGQIVSQYDGRILELTAHVGEVIETGRRLASLEVEAATSKIVGVTYFPIQAGKKIAPGMTVLITPDTVKRARFGSMMGTVTEVSAFPVTKEGVTSLVGNADVVQALLNWGPAIEVVAELEPDAATFSGYKWSSSTGPALPITSGTTTTARVILERRAPITYILPMLREASGLY